MEYPNPGVRIVSFGAGRFSGAQTPIARNCLGVNRPRLSGETRSGATYSSSRARIDAAAFPEIC